MLLRWIRPSVERFQDEAVALSGWDGCCPSLSIGGDAGEEVLCTVTEPQQVTHQVRFQFSRVTRHAKDL